MIHVVGLICVMTHRVQLLAVGLHGGATRPPIVVHALLVDQRAVSGVVVSVQEQEQVVVVGAAGASATVVDIKRDFVMIHGPINIKSRHAAVREEEEEEEVGVLAIAPVRALQVIKVPHGCKAVHQLVILLVVNQQPVVLGRRPVAVDVVVLKTGTFQMALALLIVIRINLVKSNIVKEAPVPICLRTHLTQQLLMSL